MTSMCERGKIGASLHRVSRGHAIGGKPPYLKPFFGMFGYGGAIASMHLGRRALVSSKMRGSKVYTLHLNREALISNSGEKTWKTDGGIRDPLEDEIHISPHGSFTKVEIFELKFKKLDTLLLKSRLKDFYFPYIQCDDLPGTGTGKTIRPVEFQVNGDDLAEIQGGEIGITNFLSCNGPEFVLQLRFLVKQEHNASLSPGSKLEANARLKCVYFPIIKGKENIDRILEKLHEEGCEVSENFDTFSRVSIRRLGRLLPDARWGKLPFMEQRQKKGHRGQVLKRCGLRVKCFVDTDAGFNPTPSKTDLAQHHPFSSALRNFGNKSVGKESNSVSIEIQRGGKPLSLSHLEKEYDEWILQMHDQYDEEVVCGDDEPVLVLNPTNREKLGISSDVVRVHKVIRRKEATWKSGQKIKILKGATGCYSNNIYATLEYILLEGFQGDVGGEARLICRPLHVPEKNGCLLELNGGSARLDICDSLSFPISIIDSEKCQAMDIGEWNLQVGKLRQKALSTIGILNEQELEQLEFYGALPIDATVHAGHAIPKEIVAVIRPASFTSCSDSRRLEQKFIIKEDLEVAMELKFFADEGDNVGSHMYAERIKPSSRNGFHGLYIFSAGSKFPELFNKSGIYAFIFTAFHKDYNSMKCENRVKVLPSTVGKWELILDERSPPYHVRVGSCFPRLSIACFDLYGNRMPFLCTPDFVVKINAKGDMVVKANKMEVDVSINKMSLCISNILIESSKLDHIQPNYEATLKIQEKNKPFSVSIPCLVKPGLLHRVCATSLRLERPLLPGDIIDKLVLEMFDAFGNHVEKGFEVLLSLDGFRFRDRKGLKREADDNGCIDLSGSLEVVKNFGKKACISVEYDGKTFLKKEFQLEERSLKLASEIPCNCAAGSQLENIEFVIVNSEGGVDETVHHDTKAGRSHTLKINSASSVMDEMCHYYFRKGRCIVPHISIPLDQGTFSFQAAYSQHPNLKLDIKVRVLPRVRSHINSVPENDEDGSSGDFSGRILPPSKSPTCLSKNLQALIDSIMNDGKKLGDDASVVALRIRDHEKELETLSIKKEEIEKEILDIQASIGPESLCQLERLDKEKDEILKVVEGKEHTAASVFCQIEKTIKAQELQNLYMQDIVGLVFLLGAVSCNSLSRMFAEYLGEENMLAVVCKSYAVAGSLECYDEESGRIDREQHLHAIANEFGKSIKGRFSVICVENISPYDGELEDPGCQRKLALPPPTLPNGETPQGFLGFAVNMINIDVHHLYTRTSRGHGLRDTLFYLLFGELQVYKTRQDMRSALCCIKHGAISLDGGIMKGNGFLALGDGEPEVRFPVITTQVDQSTSEALRKVSERRLELEGISNQSRNLKKARDRAMKQYTRKRERFSKYLDEKLPLVGGCKLEFEEYISNTQ
ncbi:hypothetical protein Scep_025500 [Stephania cephalantha]|uniref:Structural maintenance of chromosomes flexible hinge domain-containing protein GMI1 n=1 Tax=Stephania cephalantha TaxID=152367 RepID=A0AAP0EIC5_9MAGN